MENSYFINLTFNKICLFLILVIIFYLKLRLSNLKISIIIPTYNRGKILSNSIKSVLNQTFKNLEIIVIDDGSNDNTKEVIDKLNDDRIKYIKLNKNCGGSFARNLGIKIASGQFISFQDSDDIFLPNKIEMQLKNIINKKSDLDFCKIKVFINSSFDYLVPNIQQEKSILEGNIISDLISKGNFISTQAILIKKKFMQAHLFDPKIPRLQDYDIILSMIPKVRISYTKKVLVELHIQKNSLTLSREKLKKAIYILLNKNYNFNAEQKANFLKYLTNISISFFKKSSKKN